MLQRISPSMSHRRQASQNRKLHLPSSRALLLYAPFLLWVCCFTYFSAHRRSIRYFLCSVNRIFRWIIGYLNSLIVYSDFNRCPPVLTFLAQLLNNCFELFFSFLAFAPLYVVQCRNAEASSSSGLVIKFADFSSQLLCSLLSDCFYSIYNSSLSSSNTSLIILTPILNPVQTFFVFKKSPQGDHIPSLQKDGLFILAHKI